MTASVENAFGARVMVVVLLNNQLTDFSFLGKDGKPVANRVELARPRSSMAPTIVVDQKTGILRSQLGHLVVAASFYTLPKRCSVLDWDLDMQAAIGIGLPHQPKRSLELERVEGAESWADAMEEGLKALGQRNSKVSSQLAGFMGSW